MQSKSCEFRSSLFHLFVLRLSSYSLMPFLVFGGSVLQRILAFHMVLPVYRLSGLFSLSLLRPFFPSLVESQFIGVLARGLPLPSGLGNRVCLARQVDRPPAASAVGQKTYARMSCPHARCVLRPKGRGYYSYSIYLQHSA